MPPVVAMDNPVRMADIDIGIDLAQQPLTCQLLQVIWPLLSLCGTGNPRFASHDTSWGWVLPSRVVLTRLSRTRPDPQHNKTQTQARHLGEVPRHTGSSGSPRLGGGSAVAVGRESWEWGVKGGVWKPTPPVLRQHMRQQAKDKKMLEGDKHETRRKWQFHEGTNRAVVEKHQFKT